MNHETSLESLSKNFRDEQKALLSIGINNWTQVQELREEVLYELAQTTNSTLSNLKRIKGISVFVCELKLTPAEASLLIHAGIGSIKALSNSTPQEVLNKTGRLKRQLSFYTDKSFDLTTANKWIKHAKAIGKAKTDPYPLH